jgi:hypothetical protein
LPRGSTCRADAGTLPLGSARSVTSSTLLSSVKPFDHANRIVRADVILDPRRQQAPRPPHA